MKIDKTTPPLPATQIGELATRSPNAKPKGSSTATGDSVHLGAASSQLRGLESSIANSPVVNAEKVQAIKQAISEGRFQVNNSMVADRLIDSVKELISASEAGSKKI